MALEVIREARVGRRHGWRWLPWLGLVVMSVLQLLPFWVAITTATKSPSDTTPQLVPPLTGIFWQNFAMAVGDGHVLLAILNSVIVTGVSTAFVCLLGAAAAYPLARRLTRWNRLLTSLILALIMIPPLSILVPLYSMLTSMHAINTYWGIILVMVAGQLPFSIFLYSNFIRTVPISLEEAAALDGASTFQSFFRIVLPLLKPVTATVVILTGANVWNEYALSSFILTTPSIQTIAPAIASFFSYQSDNLGAAAAASLFAVVPVIIAYLFLQNYFISGMVAGAEK